MRPHRAVLPTLVTAIAASALAGCATTNVRAPFVDPASSAPHAVIFSKPPSGLYGVSLYGVDGQYALYTPSPFPAPRAGASPVQQMSVMPGKRTVEVECWKKGTDTRAFATLTFDVAAGQRYEVRCTRGHQPGPTWRGTEYAEYSVFDSDGNAVPFEGKANRGFY